MSKKVIATVVRPEGHGTYVDGKGDIYARKFGAKKGVKPKKIGHVERKAGFFYFVDGNGKVWEMTRPKAKKDKKAKPAKAAVKKSAAPKKTAKKRVTKKRVTKKRPTRKSSRGSKKAPRPIKKQVPYVGKGLDRIEAFQKARKKATRDFRGFAGYNPLTGKATLL